MTKPHPDFRNFVDFTVDAGTTHYEVIGKLAQECAKPMRVAHLADELLQNSVPGRFRFRGEAFDWINGIAEQNKMNWWLAQDGLHMEKFSLAGWSAQIATMGELCFGPDAPPVSVTMRGSELTKAGPSRKHRSPLAKTVEGYLAEHPNAANKDILEWLERYHSDLLPPIWKGKEDSLPGNYFSKIRGQMKRGSKLIQ